LLSGNTFTPTIFSDSNVAGSGSLRAAIIAANNDPGGGTDTIQLSAGTYTLSIGNANSHENASLSGDLNITSTAHTLVIAGAGPTATIIRQTAVDRLFEIAPNVTVVFQNLEITGGIAVDSGAANELPFANGVAEGGGILNAGNTTLSSVVVKGNIAGEPTGQDSIGDGAQALGGGIFNSGTIAINACVISGNSAIGGNGVIKNSNNVAPFGGNALGGGLFSSSALTTGVSAISITNTTLSGNVTQGGAGANGGAPTTGSAAGAEGGVGAGGGICLVQDTLPDILVGDTVSGNIARGGVGGSAQITVATLAASGGDGGDAAGGGIYWYSDPLVMLANDTFDSNNAAGGNAGSAGNAAQFMGLPGSVFGGGVSNNDDFGLPDSTVDDFGSFSVVNVTITANVATTGAGAFTGVPNVGAVAQGGGINFEEGSSGGNVQNTLILLNSAVAAPGSSGTANGVDAFGEIEDPVFFVEGNNLIGINDLPGIFTASSDFLGSVAQPITNGVVGPLQNNGGPTATRMPLGPALNRGNSNAAKSAGLTTDQRGFTPSGGVFSDIGAVQHSAAFAAGTTTALTASVGQIVSGHPITFTATVEQNGVPAAAATGTVEFLDGTKILGSTLIRGGLATFTTTLSTGGHSITAKYVGDKNFQGSTSNALTETAQANPANISLLLATSLPAPVAFGQPITFTATIEDGGQLATNATGNVTFTAGTILLGVESIVNGVATLEMPSNAPFLLPGTYQISAVYSGDSTFPSAKSRTIIQTIL